VPNLEGGSQTSSSLSWTASDGTNSGRRLYIVAGSNFGDHAFDLTRGPVGARIEVTPAIKDLGRETIRAGIETLARQYGYDDGVSSGP
jgi:hypothetical protein